MITNLQVLLVTVFLSSKGSFSHGLSPPFVQQNQYSTPATTSIQLELTYQRGLL